MRVAPPNSSNTHISLEKANSDEREYLKARPSTTALILLHSENEIFVFTYEGNLDVAVSSLLSRKSVAYVFVEESQ